MRGAFASLGGRIDLVKTMITSNKWDGAAAELDGSLVVAAECEFSLNGKAGVLAGAGARVEVKGCR